MRTTRPEPDCATCIRFEDCAVAASIREQHQEDPRFTDGTPWGTFCAAWQSKAPEGREPDPNDLWNRGEDVEF